METEITDKHTVIRFKYKIPAILFLAFLIYYIVMMLLAPLIAHKTMNDKYGFRLDDINPSEQRIVRDSVYLKLLKEKAFLQSKVEMAETDSIYLVVNLSDSIVNLGISGVTVYSSEIKRYNISKLLKQGYPYVISSMLSSPLTIIKEFSSIQKEPLMIKMAPRDTSEYQPDIIPDTADYDLVNYIFEMDKGIIIYICQEEKLNPGNGMDHFGFDLRYRIRNAINSLKSVIRVRVPGYHPFIKLHLSRDDAKIIYRALPKQGQIAIYL